MDFIWNGELRSYSYPRTEESTRGISGVGSYIDDIVIYNDSWEEHLRTLKVLFGRLRRARITTRPTKCLLGANRMQLEGHQIGGDVIMPSGDNLEKVRETPHLTSSKKESQNWYNGMRYRSVLIYCSKR